MVADNHGVNPEPPALVADLVASACAGYRDVFLQLVQQAGNSSTNTNLQ